MAIINGQGRVGVRVTSGGSSGGGSIVTNGLIINLDAGNAASYPGTGTIWTDLSGNGNNGTLVNGVGYSSADGGYLTFDGSNDRVDTSYIFPSNTSFTVTAWAKSTSNGLFNRLFGNAPETTGLSGMDIIWGYGGGTSSLYGVRRNGSNDGSRDISYLVPNLNTGWYNIVYTYDHSGAGSKLYVNNTQVASQTTLGFLSILPFKIGSDGNGISAFNGSISSVNVYNRALTSTEITQNFDALKSRYRL